VGGVRGAADRRIADAAPERGLTSGQAFLVVNTVYALTLAWLAARSRFSRAGRFAALFTIVFGVQTVMAHSETLFFGEAFDFSTLNLPALVALNASCALAAATALTAFLAPGLLFPNDAMPEPVRHRHFIELVVSMMAWGVVASLILAPLARVAWRDRRRTA
jgi:hypothetical protein